jgi:hypothetical protein
MLMELSECAKAFAIALRGAADQVREWNGVVSGVIHGDVVTLRFGGADVPHSSMVSVLRLGSSTREELCALAVAFGATGEPIARWVGSCQELSWYWPHCDGPPPTRREDR